jgi:coatomer subunit beta
MDILRALTTPNIDIRKKTLGITRNIISNRNVHDVVNFLKKEIVASESSNDSLASPYRTLLGMYFLLFLENIP